MENKSIEELVLLERMTYASGDATHPLVAALLEAKREIKRLTDLLDEVGVVA